MSVIALVLALFAARAEVPEGASEPAVPAEAAAPAATVVTASLTVAVPNRDDAAAAIVALAQSKGGWFTETTADHVALRVPPAVVDEVLQAAGEGGVVMGRSFAARDVGADLADKRARLAAREVMLDRYFDVLTTAGPDAVVAVEREITRLVGEIESLEGQLRYLEHQVDHAVVDVRFQYRDRRAPVRDGTSSFGWINTLNLADLVDDFRYGRLTSDARVPRSSGAAPEGFSAFRKPRRELRAVSADSVVYRTRTVKEKPKADLAFWQEAMTRRMEDAGYTVAAASTIEAGGATGALLELTAPWAEADYSYLVAAFPLGGRLVLVEAAGEVTAFAARRDAVIAAVQGARIGP
jgi:hypothetical protein